MSFAARDGTCWAIAALVRPEGATFTTEERDLLAGVSAVVAEGLRDAVAVEVPSQAAPHNSPAVVVLGATGEVEAITPEAEHWLAEIVRGSATA